jgi:hypothetical protein
MLGRLTDRPRAAVLEAPEIAPSILAVVRGNTSITATPFMDCDSMCSLLLTLVVRERSKIETTGRCLPAYEAERPV